MSNRRSSRLAAAAVALAAVIALTGCGGSTHAAGNQSPAAAPASTTSQAAHPTATRSTSTSTSTRATSTPATRKRAKQPAATAIQPVRSTQRRFLILGNAVCRTVRIGAPAPVRPNAPAGQVSAYARAALPAAQRTAVSLQRIGTHVRHARAFDQVARDFNLLSSLYLQAAGRAHKGHALLTSIDSAERRAASDARRSGLPACAPGRASS